MTAKEARESSDRMTVDLAISCIDAAIEKAICCGYYNATLFPSDIVNNFHRFKFNDYVKEIVVEHYKKLGFTVYIKKNIFTEELQIEW